MTVAQTKAARRRIKAHYRKGKATLTVHQSIARERVKAVRMAAAAGKKKA